MFVFARGHVSLHLSRMTWRWYDIKLVGVKVKSSWGLGRGRHSVILTLSLYFDLSLKSVNENLQGARGDRCWEQNCPRFMTSYKIMNIMVQTDSPTRPNVAKICSEATFRLCLYHWTLEWGYIYGWLPNIGSPAGNCTPGTRDLVTDKNLNIMQDSLCNPSRFFEFLHLAKFVRFSCGLR